MVSFVSGLLYAASKHCMSARAVLAHGGGAPFRGNMIDAVTNVTGHTMTALELFIALILLLVVMIWIFGRWQREE
jgi:hypothetical protein